MMNTLAAEIAARCSDAYSFDAYANWTAVAAMLLRRGYSPDQTEDIMRSKLTRWAGDASNAKYGRYTSADVARFLDRNGHPGKLLDWQARHL